MRSNTTLLLVLLAGIGCQKAVDPAAEAFFSRLAAEGDLITASRVQTIPTNPSDAAWGSVPEIRLPLVSQTSVIPRSPVVQRSELLVKALHNRREVGFLLSWKDTTRDDLESGATRFRDAVAIGLPLNHGAGPHGASVSLPYTGMGNKGRPMNIWHWKASWQKDIEEGYQGVAEAYSQMVPNTAPIVHRTGAEAGSPLSELKRSGPVENLIAEGFGTLTPSPDKDLKGRGIWQNGEWQVVIRRRMTVHNRLLPVTFAIWDGSNAERNGMKGLTRWRFVRFEGETAPIFPIWEDGDVKRGRELTRDAGCVSCHNLPDSPAVNDVGPDLAHAGAIHRPEYLMESVKDPNAVIVPGNGYFDPQTGTSTMPSFEGALEEKDFRDIASYLRSLQ